jgi:hypothetical protein
LRDAPPRALGDIQGTLAELYDVRVPARVEDFVCGRDLVELVVGAEAERGEVLVVAEEADGVSVGLYVDPQALAALARAGRGGWHDGCFEASCLATEGVSHFVYLMFRAEHAYEVSQLELEVQGEVDKYVTALWAGARRGLRRSAVSRSRALRRRLFHDVRYRDAPGSPAGDRYRVANRVAARFAEHLERRHLERGDLRTMATQLRRFYRMGAREKLELAGAM